MPYQIIQTSAHDTGLPNKSVDMIVTSPPYFGLRRYAGEQDVDWQETGYFPMPGLPPFMIPAMRCPLGAEPTPEAYIGHLMLVMREMWRVLKDHGTCWVNLGDSYVGGGGFSATAPTTNSSISGRQGLKGALISGGVTASKTLPAKNLVQIPSRFALAAQGDGWYLRSDVIWAKSNPMPESVKDRLTRSHEYIYLLTKSPKYYYDAEAIKEPAVEGQDLGFSRGLHTGNSETADTVAWHAQSMKDRQNAGVDSRTANESATRNKRSVWTISTQPYPEAHYAVFPTEIPEICIKAGSSAKGVCPSCGKPWRRMTKRTVEKYNHKEAIAQRRRNAGANSGGTEKVTLGVTGGVSTATIGWEPTCTCDAGEPIPATVLDPFSGSGTSLRVAVALGRHAIGTDISAEYLNELVPERLSGIQLEMPL